MGTNTYGYAYDPIGNRAWASLNAVTNLYASNPLNQYTNILRDSAPPREDIPTYDEDGNMTATGDGWHFAWNGENRLILASNDTVRVAYAYDHQGRMFRKEISRRGAGAQSWDLDKTLTYLWDDYNIIAEYAHTPTLPNSHTNYYVWGLDLSGTLQGAGGVGGLLAEVKDGVPYFAAFDANGNVTEYVATNGTVAAHYEYSPFGELTAQTGDLASSFTDRFSTKPWCEATDLSEYQFRKYSPRQGRWLSRDPIEERGGLNLYVCCNNASLSEVDALGFAPFTRSPVSEPYFGPLKRVVSTFIYTRHMKDLLRQRRETSLLTKVKCTCIYLQHDSVVRVSREQDVQFTFTISGRDDSDLWSKYFDDLNKRLEKLFKVIPSSGIDIIKTIEKVIEARKEFQGEEWMTPPGNAVLQPPVWGPAVESVGVEEYRWLYNYTTRKLKSAEDVCPEIPIENIRDWEDSESVREGFEDMVIGFGDKSEWPGKVSEMIKRYINAL